MIAALLARFTFWPKLIAGGIVLGLISWGVLSIYSAIYDRGHARGVADTQQSERDCIEGSVCAVAADARAAAQKIIVADAVQRARDEAARAAGVQLEQEIAARALAEKRAAAAAARAGAAERRYQDALISNQACAVWAAAPVPCPLEE